MPSLWGYVVKKTGIVTIDFGSSLAACLGIADYCWCLQRVLQEALDSLALESELLTVAIQHRLQNWKTHRNPADHSSFSGMLASARSESVSSSASESCNSDSTSSLAIEDIVARGASTVVTEKSQSALISIFFTCKTGHHCNSSLWPTTLIVTKYRLQAIERNKCPGYREKYCMECTFM